MKWQIAGAVAADNQLLFDLYSQCTSLNPQRSCSSSTTCCALENVNTHIIRQRYTVQVRDLTDAVISFDNLKYGVTGVL